MSRANKRAFVLKMSQPFTRNFKPKNEFIWKHSHENVNVVNSNKDTNTNTMKHEKYCVTSSNDIYSIDDYLSGNGRHD